MLQLTLSCSNLDMSPGTGKSVLSWSKSKTVNPFLTIHRTGQDGSFEEVLHCCKLCSLFCSICVFAEALLCDGNDTESHQSLVCIDHTEVARCLLWIVSTCSMFQKTG